MHEIEIELGFMMHFTKMKLACFVAVVYAFLLVVDGASFDVAFDDIYEVVWGGDHVNFLNERRDAQLWMDPAYGSVQFICIFDFILCYNVNYKRTYNRSWFRIEAQLWIRIHSHENQAA